MHTYITLDQRRICVKREAFNSYTRGDYHPYLHTPVKCVHHPRHPSGETSDSALEGIHDGSDALQLLRVNPECFKRTSDLHKCLLCEAKCRGI